MTDGLTCPEPRTETTLPPRPAVRASSGPCVPRRDHGYLALLLRGLQQQGRSALYAGTHTRLIAIASDARMRSSLPSERRWELPPISRVVRAAREGIPQVLREAAHDLSILGMMCLPPRAAETLLDPARRGQFCLVVDGIDFQDPDGRLAAQGLSDLARRTGAAILVLP